MNKLGKNLIFISLLIGLISCGAKGFGEKETVVLLRTTMGNIKVKLYNDTPIHRDNFIKLVNAGVYNDVSFHRVISSFMIQTGNVSTKKAGIPAGGDTLMTYTIPAEFNYKHYHKRGALAAARLDNSINPEMRSSGTQFYIVQGSYYNDQRLDQMEKNINATIEQSYFNMFLQQVNDSSFNAPEPLSTGEVQDIASTKMFKFLTEHEKYKMTDKQRQDYKTIGGTPSLDGTYTVFGEVVDGLDVVDKIANVATNSADVPINEVKIIEATIVKK